MFKKGDLVRYIPIHAKDSSHKDCENGVVSSINDNYVFVKYNIGVCMATYPKDLKLRSELKVMGKVYK